MSILDAARRHFGPRWKPSVRVVGGPGQFKQKLAELQKEIRHLQRAYERLQLADLQQPDRGMVTPDIRVISPRVEEELATLHGWTVSLVETTFSLIMLERGRDEEDALRAEWKLHM